MLKKITSKGWALRLFILAMVVVTSKVDVFGSSIHFDIEGQGSVTMNGITIFQSDNIDLDQNSLVQTITYTPANGWKFFKATYYYNGVIADSTSSQHTINFSQADTIVKVLFINPTDWLHFVSLKDGGTVKLNKEGAQYSNLTATFQYSKDRKTWTDYTWPDNGGKGGSAITLTNAGDTVFFRAKGADGKNATLSTNSESCFNFVFGENDSIAAGGNIMSLYNDSCLQDTMTDYGFYSLFTNAKQLVSAPKLPATKLAVRCYAGMFNGCTGLTTASRLPATQLADACYNAMFANCTALTAAPALPANILAPSCYASMFCGCSSLVEAPDLKATQLANFCYELMFGGCIKLEIDTCANGCDGAELVVPATGANSWNVMMFDGCKGAYANNIQLGGHYCIKPYVETLLDEMTVTVDTLKALKGKKVNIKLGRSFVKDGQYNTVCLPFSLSPTQLAQSPLAGYSLLQEFTSAKVKNYGKADETLVINMSDVDHIQAGHPYIIEWDSIGDTIANPVFKGVTVTTEYATNKAQLDGAIMFFGTFTPFMVYENDMDFIFVDDKSQLSWPNRTNLFKAFRAYFQINKANPAGLRSGMNAIFGSDDDEEGTTRVLDLNSSDDASKARKLMLEGRVVIEKAGRYFDMTGKELK